MKNIIIILSSLILFSCTNTNKWEVLFDGEKVNGLRGYRQSGFPSNDWTIVDGTLKTIPGHGVDLISENVYKDFELELEWKVTTGGNSGIGESTSPLAVIAGVSNILDISFLILWSWGDSNPRPVCAFQ